MFKMYDMRQYKRLLIVRYIYLGNIPLLEQKETP